MATTKQNKKVLEDQKRFMQMAVDLSQYALDSKCGGPFGAIIVRKGEIVGSSGNKVFANCDPTAHAEVVAIRDACQNLGSFQLEGCEVYTSCEPCPMCLGAIYWARPAIIYFANNRQDAANSGFDDSMLYEEMAANIEDRKIPIKSIGREEALKVFADWTDKTDKTKY